MSTTTDEITVDLGAIDAKKATEPKKGAPKDDKVLDKGTTDAAPAPDATKTSDSTALSPEAGLEKLKKQLEDEQKARKQAETERADADRRAAEAAKGEADAKGEVLTSQLDLVKNAITTLTTANDQLEAKYAESMAAQDYAGAAKAQREMSTNAAKLVQLESGKTQLEKAPKPAPRASADPVERFIAGAPEMGRRSADWLRAHPEFVRDSAKNRRMILAHEIAVTDEGLKPNTDEYFASIEKNLGIGTAAPAKTDDDDEPLTEAARATTTRSAAPSAAPPSRSGNGAGGTRPNVVRLTAEQREIAKLNGMTDEEYAREVVALRQEGKLN